MADLKIDFAALRASSASLQQIAGAFDRLESRVSGAEDDWGSSAIAGAMGDFAGDWDSHRRKVVQALTSMRQLVDQALEGFQQTDGRLAGALQTDGSGRPGGPR